MGVRGAECDFRPLAAAREPQAVVFNHGSGSGPGIRTGTSDLFVSLPPHHHITRAILLTRSLSGCHCAYTPQFPILGRPIRSQFSMGTGNMSHGLLTVSAYICTALSSRTSIGRAS